MRNEGARCLGLKDEAISEGVPAKLHVGSGSGSAANRMEGTTQAAAHAPTQTPAQAPGRAPTRLEIHTTLHPTTRHLHLGRNVPSDLTRGWSQ